MLTKKQQLPFLSYRIILRRRRRIRRSLEYTDILVTSDNARWSGYGFTVLVVAVGEEEPNIRYLQNSSTKIKNDDSMTEQWLPDLHRL